MKFPLKGGSLDQAQLSQTVLTFSAFNFIMMIDQGECNSGN